MIAPIGALQAIPDSLVLPTQVAALRGAYHI